MIHHSRPVALPTPHHGSASHASSSSSSRVVFTPAHGSSAAGRIHAPSSASRSTPKKRVGSDFSSPTMVSTDISTPGSGSDRSGTPTPSTPPPRHVKKMSSDESEVWYQKWWMCGFTDALNLNGN